MAPQRGTMIRQRRATGEAGRCRRGDKLAYKSTGLSLTKASGVWGVGASPCRALFSLRRLFAGLSAAHADRPSGSASSCRTDDVQQMSPFLLSKCSLVHERQSPSCRGKGSLQAIVVMLTQAHLTCRCAAYGRGYGAACGPAQPGGPVATGSCEAPKAAAWHFLPHKSPCPGAWR